MSQKEAEQMSRKDRERERHRGEILDAAERVFASKGYHAATVEQIAKEAQFAVGTLYNLFKGKEEIYARVIERLVEDFEQRFAERVLAVEDSERAIAALIELRISHFEEHREFIRLGLAASTGARIDPACLAVPDIAQRHDRYVQAVAGIFKKGIEQGVFDGVDPFYLSLSLDGMLHAFVCYWSKNPPSEPLEVRVAKLQRGFIGRIKVRPMAMQGPGGESLKQTVSYQDNGSI